MRYQMTYSALDRIGKLWVKIMKQKIRKSGKVASGELLESIDYRVIPDGENGFLLEIQFADYFKFVNEGRRKGLGPKASQGGVPIPALTEWISQKKLKGRDKKGRFITNLSLAFAIRYSIYKYGIKPTNIYDRSLDSLMTMLNPAKIPASTPPELRDELERIFDAAREDINVIIENMITEEITTIR